LICSIKVQVNLNIITKRNKMKITKILVALSFLFAVTANAGEMTVTGNMESTYHTEGTGTTGNPLGMDKELTFAGSTELDNGITVSVMQDTTDALAFSNSQISFGNIMGMATVYVGSDHDPMDAIDDITPSAYEEANGSGSGTYVDIGSNASQMGIGTKFSVPFLGAVNYKYYPKIDATKNADNSASGDALSTVGSANAVTITTDLSVLASEMAGATLTTGYADYENNTTALTDDGTELTAALNYVYGPVSFGFQKKYQNKGMTSATQDAVFYKDDILGIAYAVNDSLSVSYNVIDSYKHKGGGVDDSASSDAKQKTKAVSIGYAIGGMTIGFQDASTSNAAYLLNADDDTRTLGVAIAF
jgi:hypothetical protein